MIDAWLIDAVRERLADPHRRPMTLFVASLAIAFVNLAAHAAVRLLS